MNQERSIKRGAFRRKNCEFIGAWFPREWVELIDKEVAASDLDRSKVLRRAIRERLGAIDKTQMVAA